MNDEFAWELFVFEICLKRYFLIPLLISLNYTFHYFKFLSMEVKYV